MRIVHVITRMAMGGSERRLLDIVNALPEAEHVVLYGPESSLAGLGRLPDGMKAELVPGLVRDVRPFSDLRALFALGKQLRRGAPDLVVTHQSKASILGRVAIAACSGQTPLAHSASMASFGEGYSRSQDRLFRILERITSRWVFVYLVVGRDLRDRLLAAGVPRSKLRIIRSDARLAPFLDMRSRSRVKERIRWLGLKADSTLLIAFAGSLEPRKGVQHLIPIIDELRMNRNEAVQLIIAGEGPLRSELQTGAARLGSCVRLLGHTDDLPSLLLAADVVVLPSSAEGLPQVLIQAAACGTPFVSTPVDGASELLALGVRGRISVSVSDFPEHIAQIAVEARPAAPPEGAFDSWRPARIVEAYRAALLPALATATASRGR